MIKIDCSNYSGITRTGSDFIVLALIKMSSIQLCRELARSLKIQKVLAKSVKFALDNGAPVTAKDGMRNWTHERRVYLTIATIVNCRAVQALVPIDNRSELLRDRGLDWYGNVSEQSLYSFGF